MSSPISGRPLPSSFDDNEEFYNESGLQKVLRRMKKEPLVPLGCLLTVAAFTNAYRAMRKGDHHQVQRMFRARVLAQGFTIVAMVAGGLYFGAERHKEREMWKQQQEEKADEKRQKWIRELEVRDEEEKELRARLEKRKEKKRAADAEAIKGSFRAAEAKKNEAEAAAANATTGVSPEAVAASSNTPGSSWGMPGWLGGQTSPEQGNTKSPHSKPDASSPKE
ncbi:hypoxia induced protein conserved region-domain-containing protein [Coniella lustricola]|uniref:Hypoxia induced protein conserved region-domain-containing protein n=1 Tax=Coniella lustricola TaxID=2025994 RepID=A0A2T3AAI2_9PEZI|nr:hypoxia induced protein conserved region-domain-containing protein [Coniella lustricola]